MMLEAVVIVLREVLEAALLVSLLLLMCRQRGIHTTWLIPATITGLGGAMIYASQLAWVSERWDYSGQEIVNATMQLLIFLSVCCLFLLVNRPKNSHHGKIAFSMALVVALALAREVSEIFLYLQAFWGTEKNPLPVLMGAAVGAMTGVSTGVLIYYLVAWMDIRRSAFLVAGLLAVTVAGIATQAVSLLEQVDRIPYSPPIWDTSHWVAEDTLLGQLLYALLGYEATPTVWHVSTYALVLLTLALAYASPKLSGALSGD